MKPILLAAAAASLALLSSCTTTQTSEDKTVSLRSTQNQPDRPYSYFEDQEVDAPLSVRIVLSEQTAHFYRGDVKVGQSRVATGRSGHRTPTGSFRILEKKQGKRSNLYGKIYDAAGNLKNSDADTRIHSVPAGGKFVGCSMPYWMRLTGSGIGMHVGPIPNPGSPASHGCIRMPRHMASTLFQHAPRGTKVTIVP